MKPKQQQEIVTLDKIIEDSNLKFWDGINNGASGKYKEGVCEYIAGSEKRINPEKAYFQHNGGGKKGFITGDIKEKIRFNKLCKAKEKYDLMMKMWIEDVSEGLLSLKELEEDGYSKEANIIRSKLNPHRELNGIEKAILNNRRRKKDSIFTRIYKYILLWTKKIKDYLIYKIKK